MKRFIFFIFFLSSYIAFPQSITVTSPNGGETIDGCTDYNITWNESTTSLTFNIDYSVDGGQTWISLASFYTSTSFLWSIPNIYSNSCLIRVYDATDPQIADQSDFVFTIVAPVQIIYPNGGEVLNAHDVFNLTYSTAPYVSAVKLDYSINGGISWSNIDTYQSGGSYDWTIPNIPSSQVLVRVQDQSVTCRVDESDAVFEIVSEVEVTTPNGSEQYQATVTPFTSTGVYLMDNGTITTDGGRFFDSGGESANYADYESFTKYFWPSVATNDLRMTFTRFYIQGGNADRLRVYDATTNQQLLDLTGDLTSSLHTNPRVATGKGLKVVFSSNYSANSQGWDANIESIETVYSGTTHPINWNITGTSKEFHLDYSINNGATWNRIMSNYYTLSGNYDWPVPSVPSANCLVRVMDAQNNTVVDISDNVFEILEAIPRVLYPNGNESFSSGNNHDIEWVADFYPSASVQIEYSIDGGTVWNIITSSTPNDGVFDWLLPSTNTTTALVRVSDVNDLSKSDASDNIFTILPHITVQYPNGGQLLEGCASLNISWASGGTSNQFRIELSKDNGLTWSDLANNVNSNSWSWSVIDNQNVADALIRVSDANDSTKTDNSDASFEISKTTDVVMVTPNGGEVWNAWDQHQINYIKTAAVSSVRLDYSINGGISWSNIDTYQSGGSYDWTIPNIPSSQVLVRVQDQGITCRVDESDAVFEIVSEVEVTTPNGSEQYQATVTPFTSTGVYLMDNGTITTDGGRFFDSGGESANYADYESFTKYFWPSVATNDLRMTFTRFYIQGGNADRLRVYDATTNQQLLDLTGDLTSSLHTNPRVATGKGLKVVFSSNYSANSQGWDANIESIETVYSGTTHPINWNITGTSKEFHLDYSINNGATWNRIMSNYYTLSGNYDWPVPSVPSANCLVRVMDVQNNTVVDISDNVFEILEAMPEITVTYPNTATNVYIGSTTNITWQANFLNTAYVGIDYSYDNGNTWNVVSSVTPNDGTYTWNVPNTPSSIALIRIRDINDNTIYDESDLVFTLSPPISIQTQNLTGSDYRGCTVTNIEWFTGGTSGYYDLFYSTDNGINWQIIENSYYNTANFISYNWIIPNAPTSNALIKIVDVNDISKFDINNSNFIISPTITLTSLTYGGVYTTGNTVDITWNDTLTSNYYDISYSTDGGLNFTEIIANHYTLISSYSWVIPNITSTNCIIKIVDSNNDCKSDISNNIFNISNYSPSIEVTYPNGYESFSGCQDVQIQWTDTLSSNTFNIEYSIDGGLSWSTIINNFTSTNYSYLWIAPNINNPNILIRVRDAFNSNNLDISNYVFSISKSVTAEIIYSQSLSLCSGDTLVLNSNQSYGNLWSTGQSNPSINIISSGQYYLTVTDSLGCQDVSNILSVNFTIPPIAPTITANGPTILCDGESVILSSNYSSGNLWTPLGIVAQDVTVTQSGIYNVSYTSGGCSVVSQPIQVIVNNNPQIPILSSNSPVNFGSSILLLSNLTIGAQYAWSGPNGFTSSLQNPTILNVNDNDEGLYYLFIEENGCNSDSAVIYVVVDSLLSSYIAFSGDVYSENLSSIENVNVLSQGTLDSTISTTNSQGIFSANLLDGYSYDFSCNKNNDSISNNGISTLDILLIQNHILGNGLLTSPYKIIAADVNHSNSISTLDILFIQQLILQINNGYPGHDMWRFIDASYSFANPNQPFGFNENILVPSVNQNTNIEFIGMKLGDVNNSWDNLIPRIGSSGTLNFYTQETYDNFGNLVVSFYSRNFEDIRGFQFTIEWDKKHLDYIDFISNNAGLMLNNNFTNDGVLPILFNTDNIDGKTLNETEELFSISFSKNGDADYYFNITSALTKREAYDKDLLLLIPKLENNGIIEKCLQIDLFPNPFSDHLQINMLVNENSNASLSLFDQLGKILNKSHHQVNKGHNSINYNIINGIPNNTYYLLVETEFCQEVVKLVKSK